MLVPICGPTSLCVIGTDIIITLRCACHVTASINPTTEASVSSGVQVVAFLFLLNLNLTPPPPSILPSFPHWPRGKIDLRVEHYICTHHHLSTAWQQAQCFPVPFVYSSMFKDSPSEAAAHYIDKTTGVYFTWNNFYCYRNIIHGTKLTESFYLWELNYVVRWYTSRYNLSLWFTPQEFYIFFIV